MVWFGKVWLGQVRLGSVRLGWVRLEMERLSFSFVWLGLIMVGWFPCLKKNGKNTGWQKKVVANYSLGKNQR